MREKVKMLLKLNGITAKDLANKIGISEAALSLCLSGNPTLSRLTEIATALGVEVGDLLPHSGTIIKCPKCGAKLQITVVE